jgi:hypothetical protein
MNLHKINPFTHGEQDDATLSKNTTAESRLNSPSTRSQQGRRSKFLEEGIVGDEKLHLRSGHDSETLDSMAQTNEQDGPLNKPLDGPAEKEELPWYKQRKTSSAKEDPFGDEEDSDVKYKTMNWWQASMSMR